MQLFQECRYMLWAQHSETDLLKMSCWIQQEGVKKSFILILAALFFIQSLFTDSSIFYIQIRTFPSVFCVFLDEYFYNIARMPILNDLFVLMNDKVRIWLVKHLIVTNVNTFLYVILQTNKENTFKVLFSGWLDFIYNKWFWCLIHFCLLTYSSIYVVVWKGCVLLFK